ncbi:MAG: hypothetical protein ABIU58_02470 [Ramlibacter sp.]
MEPDNDKRGGAAREDFEVAHYAKELGRPLTHGEETARETENPPREDRAG